MILLLNGSINAGKTTVARRIVELLPSTAHVEVDELREFIRFMPLEQAIPLCLQNAASVTRNFVLSKLNVILSWPLALEDYEFLMRDLTPLGVPIYAITLSPDLAVALTNRGTRELTEWEKQRIPFHYASGISAPPFGVIIDNTHQTPEETARQVLESVRDSYYAPRNTHNSPERMGGGAAVTAGRPSDHSAA